MNEVREMEKRKKKKKRQITDLLKHSDLKEKDTAKEVNVPTEIARIEKRDGQFNDGKMWMEKENNTKARPKN